MREPNYQDFNEIAAAVADGNENQLYYLVAALGVPDEIAARFYAYCADNLCSVGNAEEVRKLYNKAWQ